MKYIWQKNADMIFGGITVACGIFGSLAGGYILDRLNNTIPNAFKVVSGNWKGMTLNDKIEIFRGLERIWKLAQSNKNSK